MSKPVFEKRHYLKLAAHMFGRKPTAAPSFRFWYDEIAGLVDMLRLDNPNFQPDRFVLACEFGVNAKGVGAGINGGPAMAQFQGNTPFQTARARVAARVRRQR